MYVGELWECHHGCQVPFCTSVGTWDFFRDPVAGKGLMLRRRWNHVVFLELRRDSRVTTGDYRLPLVSALGSPIFYSSGEGKLGVVLESLQGQRDLI